MQSFLQRNRFLALHFSFWCVYLSFFLYQTAHFRRGVELGWGLLLASVAVTMLSTMLIAYVNYFWLLPRFLRNKNLGSYLLEFIVPFGLVITARVYLERYLFADFSQQMMFIYSSRFVVHIATVTFFIVIFVGMLRFAVDWFTLEARAKASENQKLTAELNFLKAQINPHFLFNTLNNLYYLAYTQSPNTTEVIEKLSQMMRYMIYDSNHPRVLLSKEIEYMENYISLERLRLNNQIPITFEVEGNPEEVLVVPLVLITFLENAFKHGASHNQPEAWVKIFIKVHGQTCRYTVSNSKAPKAGADPGEKSGIGLQNVQRRLELSYPGKYTLQVDDLPDRYAVELNLDLS